MNKSYCGVIATVICMAASIAASRGASADDLAPTSCSGLSPEEAFNRGIEHHKAGDDEAARACFTLALDGFQTRPEPETSARKWPLGDYYTPDQVEQFFRPRQIAPE